MPGSTPGRRDAVLFCPPFELRDRLFASEGTAVQTKLLEVPPCLADERPRRQPEELHDLVAVQVRPDPGEILLGRDSRDPLFQLVVGALQRRGLALVARRAVRAD